jgi:hypothetical protein
MQILDTSRLLADVFFWGNKNIFTHKAPEADVHAGGILVIY